MDDAAHLGGFQILKPAVGVAAHKDGAVLAGQHAAIRRVSPSAVAELAAGIPPVEGTVQLGVLHPHPADLIAVGNVGPGLGCPGS